MDLQYLSSVYWCAKQAQSSKFSGSVPCCFDLGTLEEHVRCLSPSGLLLSCSCSTSLDSAFLQRRAALQARCQRRPRREHRRDVLTPPTGASDRGVKQVLLWCNTKEATTLTVAFSIDHGPLDMLIVQAAKTDVLPEERTHHVT